MKPFLLVSLLALALLLSAQAQEATNETSSTSSNAFLVPADAESGTPPTCEGCFCVPAEGEACPTSPQTGFAADHIERLKILQWENPIYLNCDPFKHNNCTLVDSKGAMVIEQDCDLAMCGMKYNNNTPAGTCPTSYTTKTFINSEALEQDTEGYFLTHYGACGACSSTQDLAVYMELQIDGFGVECAAKGMTSESAALDCFVEKGFSPGCAAVWVYNSLYTRDKCLFPCLNNRGQAANEDAPGCPYNECLKCDETYSSETFRKTAGRSRRRSGLLSEVVHECSRLFLDVVPTDPCDYRVEPPTEPPSGGSTRSWLSMGTLMLSVVSCWLS